jgi:hypothetical protein
MGVLIDRSRDCTLALGAGRLVVSVVVVCVVVAQPANANRPAQANNTMEFFIITVLSEWRHRSILFW